MSDPTVPNPTITLTNTGTTAEFYTYTLTVTNGEAECAVTDQITVTVYPALIIAADDVDPVCVGGSIELRVTGDPSYTYAWTGPDGFTSSEQNPVIPNATEDNEGTYTVVVTNQQGCQATAEVEVDIAPLPTASAGQDQRLCTQGASTSFTVTGTPSAGAVGVWSVVEGTATIASPTSLETEVSVTSASATLRFTAETPEGCQAFDDVVLTVDPLPNVTLAPFGDICESDAPFTLTGGLPTGGTYSGPGVTDGVFDPVAAGGDGTYTITYTYTNGNGCTDTATRTITVKPQPVVAVTPDSEICSGESITLTASGATTYRWEPAAGLSATTGASVTATPTSTTTYTVYGTTNGCESVAQTVTITVSPLPDVTITPTGPTEFCPENYVELRAVESSTYTYAWFRTDNSTSVGSASSYQATETGSYYVTITTDRGCTLTSETIAVKVANVPTVATITTTGATTFCEGGSVLFGANQAPSGQSYVYEWEQSTDGVNFTTIVGEESRTYEAEATGYYRVLVSNTVEADEDTEQCTKISEAVQVTVLAQPTADITSSSETQCRAESGATTFTVTGTYSGGTGVWSATNGFSVAESSSSTVDGVTTSTATVTAPSSVTSITSTVVTLTTTNTTSACDPASDQVTLTVQPLIAGNTITGTSEYCQNAAATALSSGTLSGGNGSYTYQWQSSSSATGTFDNIPGATEDAYMPSTATGGTTYYRRVVNSGECSNTSAAFAVTVTPSITTNTITGTQSYCEDEPATALGGAVAGGTGSYTYQWQSSSSATGTFDNIPGATEDAYMPSTATGGTIYYRRLVSSGECANNVSNVIAVTVTPAITANSISGTTTYCQNATASALGGTVSGGLESKTYLWQQSPNGTDQWTTATGTSNLASYTPLTTAAGTMHYRRVVTSGECSSTSNVVAVTVTPAITANSISGTTTYCQNATASALGGTVSGGLESKTYLWQQSPNGTDQWTTATGTSNLASYTPPTTTAGTMHYRRVVTSGECSSTSNVVAVTVTPAITANSISGTTTYCQNATASALGGTVSGGLESKTYLWQQSPNGTDQWTTATGTSNLASYTPLTTAAGTLHYRRVVTSGECSSTSNVVAVTVNAPIAGNQISGTQTVCSGGTVAPLGQANGTSLSGGSTPYTYQWQSSTTLNGTYTNVTGGTGATTATYTPATRTVTSATTVYYKRVVNGGQCSSVSNAVSVTFSPAIASNTISGAQTVCAGVAPSQLTGSAPTGGSGSYTYLWESSTTSATAGFSAAAGTNSGRNYSPGALTQTTWFRRVVTSGGCSNISTAVRVLVTPTTTLTLVLKASPFPVCPGQQTTYTATVIANATAVNYPANPRYEEITWEGGTDVSSMFIFDWWKNDNVDNQEGQTGRTVSQAGLSSTDYFTVRARPNSNFNISCISYVNQPELTPNDNKGNVLFSNRIYLGQPSNYDVTISRVPEGSICQGTRVTFTATPNADYVNLTMEWIVRNSAGTIVASTPMNASRTFTSNSLNNGDVVSLNFTSEENKCQPVATSTPITMVVVIPQTMAGGGAYCAGGTGVPVSITSSQQGVTYQLLRTVGSTTEAVGSPRSGTGSAINFGNQTIAGTYTVQPISANGACSPVYGPVEVVITPRPIAYNVTPVSGASYCAGGAGVPIGMANSQAGVTYSLYRSGTTAPVETVNRTAPGAFTFPGSFTAGTYSVTATPTGTQPTVANCPQSMLNTVTITADPLPIAITATGGSYCEGLDGASVPGATITVGGTQNGVSYQLLNAAGQPVGSAVAGNGSTITLGPVNAGDYTIRATNGTTGCTNIVGQATVTETERVEPLGDIIVTNESGEVITEQELKTGQYARFIADNTFEDDRTAETYTWYIGDGTDTGWEVVPDVNGPVLTIQSIPGGDFAVRVVVTADETACYTEFVGDYSTTPVVPLPVEIIYFTAAKQGHNVLLEWATASEESNTGFEVQVSQDGFNFRKLDFVPTKNGNTVIKQVYQYTDKENGKRGTRYYRLKQLDEDGRFEYFTTKAVTFTEVASKVKAFPNPFSSKLTLDIAAEQSGEVQVSMSNAIGRHMMERTIKVEEGFNTINLDMNGDLPHGVYFIRVYLDGKMHQLKMLKE
ncbi:Ig-like domain-containing protein [Pontibacter kalidii]|uniref:Ig-like domain-containing protein n=1 Tax=Pontibacter kalidii TaxID=2592049 RepID=UPI00224F7584|nr:T9SS type A sorting domain-containing protein [Pontibacter kalidii]